MKGLNLAEEFQGLGEEERLRSIFRFILVECY